ncbi:hypothetical protein F7725_019897 [Dissostichus mawsoni]|uniref:Uncharacterized protein n=1 Tax=Dissostichus mawsoni TaxID=36200 RepID=A0A7J5YPH9_DISMA|nr:hypothetical protein F7725_019897 [Dissostichus mawsoni]
MAEDVSVSEDTLTCALSLLLNLSKVLLQTARQEAAESLEKFVPHNISILFGLITAGADFYKSNATVRDEVEELLQLEENQDLTEPKEPCEEVKDVEIDALLKENQDLTEPKEPCEEVKDGEIDALLKENQDLTEPKEPCEEVKDGEIDALLKENQELTEPKEPCEESVDRGLQTTDRQLSGGKMAASLSPDTAFTDGRSGESVTLGQFLGRGEKPLLAVLEARSVRVVVVAFGGLQGAQMWREQTGSTFDMLLDPQRKYSEYPAVGRDFPDMPPHMEDIYQLGGDFLLDEAGKVLLCHPSKSPMDRPSVEDILQAAGSSNSKSNL